MLNVFSPCVYSYFHHQLFELYEYKVEGSGYGFNQKRGPAETDLQFFIKFDMF